ncbi:hypothetical protein DICPUDRAFT_31754 [Dictyostelium purpureum]|uniref:Uncharacterized protein n=1 Tax=Dictyostelium purpureum TaxID=5786 RepID=F0ZHT5_DICPU|nr:uncharacterized protein DICPUDRAFT_31754 [Dictyostelium purpureum]EGC36466.1 hypothetical protein DICPUDRAFT_31754 [Dictyostelium purpureum]|eukprot:XP_003286979.1 hypothetical protein DICPUDRAFT_31754 [Dictyostelium purpureum]
MCQPAVVTLTKPTLHIYRDCLRLAKYIGEFNGHSNNMMKQVGLVFRSNKLEIDDKKINEQKTDAIRFLTNFMQHEAERMARNQKKSEKESTATPRTKATLD